MIGIYINFESQKDFDKVQDELQSLGGYEVGENGPDWPVYFLCQYSVDDEQCDFTEEECREISAKASEILNNHNITYSITESP